MPALGEEFPCGSEVSLRFDRCAFEAELVGNATAREAEDGCSPVDETSGIDFRHRTGLDGDGKDDAGVWPHVSAFLEFVEGEIGT